MQLNGLLPSWGVPKRVVGGLGYGDPWVLGFCQNEAPRPCSRETSERAAKNFYVNFCEGSLSSVSRTAGAVRTASQDPHHDHAYAGIRPRTHKSRLVSNGWSMSALPPIVLQKSAARACYAIIESKRPAA